MTYTCAHVRGYSEGPTKRATIKVMCKDDYPSSGVMIEMDSPVLPRKLVEKLGRSCEREGEKHLGQPHVAHVARRAWWPLLSHEHCCNAQLYRGPPRE